MLARLPARYSIASLEIDHLDVWLTVGEREIVGRLRLTAAGKQRFQQRISRTKLEDLPRQAVVSLWRPVELSTWPAPLPDPATLTREIKRPVAEPRMSEEAVPEGPGWPHPSIRLGRPGEAPASLEEVEARLLRAIRTQAVEERSGRGSGCAWLGALMVEAKFRNSFLEQAYRRRGVDGLKLAGAALGFRADDFYDFHVDGSELNARPVPFCPTPRDVSDYESGIIKSWLAYVPKKHRWYFAARAKLPMMSWRQIAEEEREHEHVVMGRYRDAVKGIYRKVGR